MGILDAKIELPSASDVSDLLKKSYTTTAKSINSVFSEMAKRQSERFKPRIDYKKAQEAINPVKPPDGPKLNPSQTPPPVRQDVGPKFSLDPYEIPLAETGELRTYACSGIVYFTPRNPGEYRPAPVKPPPKFINESMVDEAARLLERSDDIQKPVFFGYRGYREPLKNFKVNGELWDGENVR